MREDDGRGTVTVFALDPAGNVVGEQQTTDGQTTTRGFSYVANQLRTLSEAGQTRRFFYTPEGALSCVTTEAGAEGDCLIPTGAVPAPTVLESYAYDYRGRLASYRAFANEQETDSAAYRYDPLDRLAEQTERRGTLTLTTSFAYVGISDRLADEQLDPSSGPSVRKEYRYDAFGRRLGLDRIVPGQPDEHYSLAHSPHGSVSLLLQAGGTARASYGYRAYHPAAPLNPPARHAVRRRPTAAQPGQQHTERPPPTRKHRLSPCRRIRVATRRRARA